MRGQKRRDESRRGRHECLRHIGTRRFLDSETGVEGAEIGRGVVSGTAGNQTNVGWRRFCERQRRVYGTGCWSHHSPGLRLHEMTQGLSLAFTIRGFVSVAAAVRRLMRPKREQELRTREAVSREQRCHYQRHHYGIGELLHPDSIVTRSPGISIISDHFTC